MNKDLYGNIISLPEKVCEYLETCFNSAKGSTESTEGYNRNKELRDKREITYQQLKRIKNWFESFNGNPNDLPFILNGGDYMKNWVSETLRTMRDDIHTTKKNKSVVLPNQFIKNHQKDGIKHLNRPSQSHKSTSNKYDTSIMENLNRINDIITKTI